jgi:hypothetical protein
MIFILGEGSMPAVKLKSCYGHRDVAFISLNPININPSLVAMAWMIVG